MNKITLTEEEFRDALDEGSAETIDVDTSWRHGHRNRYRIERDGKSYAAWIDVHTEEGIQLDGDVELVEVRAVEKTVIVWETVK